MSSLALRMARQRQDHERLRFARDQAVDQAIRNYLAVASRALQVPGYLGQLLQPGGGGAVAHALGGHAGLGRETAHAMLTDHDPGALAGLLDLLQEHGIDPGAPADSPATTTQAHGLARLLAVLHHNIAGHGSALPGEESSQPHPAVVRGYGVESLGSDLEPGHESRQPRDSFRRVVRDGLVDRRTGYSTRLGQLLDSLRQYGPAEHREPLTGALATAQSGRHAGLVQAHDLSGRIDSPTGRTAHGDLTRLLQALHGHLWHYGETGDAPTFAT